MIKLIVRIVFVCCFLPSLGVAQGYSVPLTLFQQFNGPYDYTIIGKSHNPCDNIALVPQTCVMLTNSSASLNLAANQLSIQLKIIQGNLEKLKSKSNFTV